MKRNYLIGALLPLAAIAALLSPAPTRAAGPPVPPEMQQVEFLVGTWNCTWDAGGQSGALTTTFSKVMGGMWLLATESVKAKSGATVVTSMHFTGYDPATHTWSHGGAGFDGRFELVHSPDFHTFHDMLDPTAKDATLTKASDTQYTLSEPFVHEGQAGVWNETCKKT